MEVVVPRPVLFGRDAGLFEEREQMPVPLAVFGGLPARLVDRLDDDGGPLTLRGFGCQRLVKRDVDLVVCRRAQRPGLPGGALPAVGQQHDRHGEAEVAVGVHEPLEARVTAEGEPHLAAGHGEALRFHPEAEPDRRHAVVAHVGQVAAHVGGGFNILPERAVVLAVEHPGRVGQTIRQNAHLQRHRAALLAGQHGHFATIDTRRDDPRDVDGQPEGARAPSRDGQRRGLRRKVAGHVLQVVVRLVVEPFGQRLHPGHVPGDAGSNSPRGPVSAPTSTCTAGKAWPARSEKVTGSRSPRAAKRTATQRLARGVRGRPTLGRATEAYGFGSAGAVPPGAVHHLVELPLEGAPADVVEEQRDVLPGHAKVEQQLLDLLQIAFGAERLDVEAQVPVPARLQRHRTKRLAVSQIVEPQTELLVVLARQEDVQQQQHAAGPVRRVAAQVQSWPGILRAAGHVDAQGVRAVVACSPTTSGVTPPATNGCGWPGSNDVTAPAPG